MEAKPIFRNVQKVYLNENIVEVSTFQSIYYREKKMTRINHCVHFAIVHVLNETENVFFFFNFEIYRLFSEFGRMSTLQFEWTALIASLFLCEFR